MLQNGFIILIVKKIHNIFIFIMIKNDRVLEHSRVFQNPISFEKRHNWHEISKKKVSSMRKRQF